MNWKMFMKCNSELQQYTTFDILVFGVSTVQIEEQTPTYGVQRLHLFLKRKTQKKVKVGARRGVKQSVYCALVVVIYKYCATRVRSVDGSSLRPSRVASWSS